MLSLTFRKIKSNYIPLTAVTLRLITALSRFSFIILASKHMSPSEFGTYGLATSFIAIFVQWVGLEFYVYSQREALSLNNQSTTSITIKQLKFNIISFAFFIPIIVSVLAFKDFNSTIFILIISVLFFEYISQELSRILVFLLRPLAATTLIFIRNGIWPIAAITMLLNYETYSSTEIFLSLGLIGAFFASLIGFLLIYSKKMDRIFSTPLNWEWLKSGLLQIRPFLVSAIAFKALELQDRFILEYYHGLEAFGSYFLLATLASGIQLILGTAVGQIWGPRTIKAYRHNDFVLYKINRRSWIYHNIFFGFFSILGAVILIGPTLQLIGKAEYIEQINVFYILLLSQLLMTAAEFWQMELYARKLDKWMPISALIAFVFGALANFILIPIYSGIGAAIATCIGFMVLTLVRYIGLKLELKISHT